MPARISTLCPLNSFKEFFAGKHNPDWAAVRTDGFRKFKGLRRNTLLGYGVEDGMILAGGAAGSRG
jgi:hypothetical protein